MLFVGAGSGITPLMSMSRWIIDTTADVDVKFLVSARTPADVIFRRELEFLSARHSGFKAAVTITAGGGGHDGWIGLTGRICPPLLELVCPDVRERHVFTCGPEPFMDKLEEALTALGFDMRQFHKESFGVRRVAQGTQVPERDALPRSLVDVPLVPPGPPSVAHSIVDAVPDVAAGQYEIEFAKSGKTVRSSGDASLLEIAEANGIEIDYACRNGACGACKVACQPPVSVEMEGASGLGAADRERGVILACVARPRAALRLDA
jgi:ferredoxin-NADP reductase